MASRSCDEGSQRRFDGPLRTHSQRRRHHQLGAIGMDLADPRHWFRLRERSQSDGPGGVDPDGGRIDRPVRDASVVQRAELAPHPLEARVIEILGPQGQQLGSIKSRGQ